MEKSIRKVHKVTAKGQITLPIFWRKKFEIDQVIVETKENKIEITPFVFSADKTNALTEFNANSASFDFLKSEPEIYNIGDLKKKYV